MYRNNQGFGVETVVDLLPRPLTDVSMFSGRKGRMLYLKKKRCTPMSQRRRMAIAEIWPSAGVFLISLAHLITCLAAGVGGV